MRWFTTGVALLLLVLLPADAEAQRRRHCCERNPWSFAPYGGLFKDAYDISPDGDDTGWQLGFRVGYDLGARTRLQANVGYAESDDVASGPFADRHVYDNQYIITTAGIEYDILPGNTAVALGAEAGGTWREVAFDRTVGTPIPGDLQESGYTFNFTLVPGLSVRHTFTPRTAFEIGVRDYIYPEAEVEHSLSLTAGFRFR